MDDHLTVKKSYHDAAFAAKGTLIADGVKPLSHE